MSQKDDSTPTKAKRTKRVLIIERAGETKWKTLEGTVGGDRIAVSGAQIINGKGLSSLKNGAETTLVSNSPRSVCRFLEMVDAPADQVQRMVALRLETELPYPVAESTWVCERQDNEEAKSVLVIATATEDISKAEDELRTGGIRCGTIEYNGGALAELAVACGGTDDTLAIVDINKQSATLAITRGGALRYVRHIAANSTTQTTERNAQTANEVDQSVYDYVLRTKSDMPTRMFVAGEEMHADGLVETLRARLGIPVESARCPEQIRLPDRVAMDECVTDFAVCLGTMIALHRRAQGERATSPPLRAQTRRFAAVDWRGKRVALVAAGLVLLAGLVAVSFSVRAAQLEAANSIIAEGRPLLDGMERLSEEVDVLKHESRRNRSMMDAFLELAEVLPSKLKIEKIDISSKGKITITGKTKPVEVASQEAMAALRDSPAFANPKFTGATKEKEEYRFGITCELRRVSGGKS